jgi:hypothetical protein
MWTTPHYGRMQMLDWHVAIYCANEEQRLGSCIDDVSAALSGMRSQITVILNGTSDRSQAFALAAARSGKPVDVVTIPVGDKSNAINQFFHNLRQPARAYGGVDGYCFVAPASFASMLARLNTDSHAMAVTGVCINGRSMKLATEETLKVGGKLHGQLHGFRHDFVERLVERGIRLPLGTYWGDGLMGSMAAHNLDSIASLWDSARVVGVAEAQYEIAELSIFRAADIRRQARRKIRQLMGRIQNAAIKEIIYRDGYEGLPEYANEMALDYVTKHGLPKAGVLDRLLQAKVLRELRQAQRFEPASLRPVKLQH